jgi:hypothetical protein
VKRRGGVKGVLGRRALNRALLARQMLLERARLSPLRALERLVGLQAQLPGDPYVALWSRLDHFDPLALSRLIEARKAVRMVVMRGTLHLLTARDALRIRPVVQPVLARQFAGTAWGRATRDVNAAALVALGRRAVEARPLALAELRPLLRARFPGRDPTALAYLFHYSAPLVQVPPRGLWRASGLPRVTTAPHWLGRALAKPVPEALVLRYLAAFGPASIRDAQAWSGLAELAPVFERLRRRLVTFREEDGRELFDLPDAPRPDPDTRAQPRFLPVYDNAILGFARRERILHGAPPRAVPQNQNLRSFLVDGFVAGFWRLDEAKGRATLLLEPFARLSRSDAADLVAEAERLLTFLAPEAAKAVVRFGKAY